METVSKIPAGDAVIGTNEVVKGIKAGRVGRVVVASNCPQFLIERVEAAGKVVVEMFAGDQKELAVRLGKPFPIAVSGFAK